MQAGILYLPIMPVSAHTNCDIRGLGGIGYSHHSERIHFDPSTVAIDNNHSKLVLVDMRACKGG